MNRNICGQISNGKKGQYSLSRRFQFLSFMMLWGKICFRFQESSRFEATAFWECPREEREVATLKKPFHLLSSSSFYASRSQMDFHILCKVKRAGWMESSHLAGSYILSYLFLSYLNPKPIFIVDTQQRGVWVHWREERLNCWCRLPQYCEWLVENHCTCTTLILLMKLFWIQVVECGVENVFEWLEEKK